MLHKQVHAFCAIGKLVGGDLMNFGATRLLAHQLGLVIHVLNRDVLEV